MPDQHGDWLSQRKDDFSEFIVLGDKKTYAPRLFENFSLGVVTNRDAWCYSAGKVTVERNMTRMIAFYNAEANRFSSAHAKLDKKARDTLVDGSIDTDPTQISWTRSLKQELAKGRNFAFAAECLTPSLYRPFTKQWLYFNRRFNEMVYQMPHIFPDAHAENLVICVGGIADDSGFSVLVANALPNLHTLRSNQCFPLYLYDEATPEDEGSGSLFKDDEQLIADGRAHGNRQRRDAITNEGLTHFQTAYPSEAICKEDLFYYVYGLLHSQQYREQYADNLTKEIPRIPCVKTSADFWSFSQAGRKLADIHLNYETVAPYPVKIDTGGTKLTNVDYRVEKMRYGKRGKEKDLTTLHYNAKVTLTGIPLDAYEYVVNGKPALDWVVERQCVKTDKDSGIVNDANDWAVETMGNPRYPLELFQRVITVSLETMKIVKALPALDI